MNLMIYANYNMSISKFFSPYFFFALNIEFGLITCTNQPFATLSGGHDIEIFTNMIQPDVKLNPITSTK